MSVIYFSPLYRPATRSISAPNFFGPLARRDYPAYDIEKTADQAYRITLEVPGFAMEDLAVTTRPNELVVTGRHVKTIGEQLRRGVVSQAFERRFATDDGVEVIGASLANGLLAIDMERRPPKAVESRTIEISGKSPRPKLVEQVRRTTAATVDSVRRWFARGRSLRSAA